MKRILAGLLMICLMSVFFWACSADENPTTYTEKEDNSKFIYINQSEFYPEGIDKVFVNQADTIKLVASTILPEKPVYSWSSSDSKVMKIEQDESADSIAWVIAAGDSGAAATIVLKDAGNNVEKILQAVVVKYWADPGFFTFIGTLNKHYYYLSTQRAYWGEAKTICEEIQNGHLVTITSKEENQLVAQGVATIKDESFAWIGLSWLIGKESWDTWVTGEAVVYENRDSKLFPGVGGFTPNSFYAYMSLAGTWGNSDRYRTYYILEME